MIRKLFTLSVIAGSVWGCSPTVDIRGNLPDPLLVAQIKVGNTSQEQVLGLIGTPSTTMTYGDEEWFYVYEKIETVSWFTPKVTDYHALTLVFDDKGKVKAIKENSKDDMKDVDLVSRETPTAGREYTILEQLISNVGKFSKDKKPSQ